MSKLESSLSTLDALGSGEVMPVLVLGYEAGAGRLQLPSPTDWLMRVDVQAGGDNLSYHAAVGVVFRLADNGQQALEPLNPLLRAFHLMSEDRLDIQALNTEYPELRGICPSFGEPYNADKLKRLSAFVQRFFRLPEAQSGLEAFVRLAPAAPDALLGWYPLRVKAPPACLSEQAAAAGLLTGPAFTATDYQELETFGRDSFSEPPNLFLIWENSD